MSGLGVRLQQSKLDMKVGGTIVSGLFFSDDLVLISKTCNRGMNKLLGIVNRFCNDMRMQFSVEKTHILTTGPKDKWWRVDKETLAAKYLGVEVQLRGRNTMRREKELVNIARRTSHAILSLTRTGLDRARVARILWESCALPTCLYGVQLGNRMKNRLGKQWKKCPWCGVLGMNISLRESHVIFMCGVNKGERQVEGLDKYLEEKVRARLAEPYLILREYLGQDGVSNNMLMGRAMSLRRLVDMWFSRVKNL